MVPVREPQPYVELPEARGTEKLLWKQEQLSRSLGQLNAAELDGELSRRGASQVGSCYD